MSNVPRCIALLASAFCIAMLGVAGPASAQDNKLKVMVDWSPHGMHAGLHLAKQKGWYQEAGLDVEVLDGKGSTSTIQQVAAGQVEVGFAQLAAMAVARANGLALTSIACFVRAGDNGVMVPKGSGYKTMKDLEGKRVAYAASSTTGPFMDAFLKASGTSRDKITLVNVDSSSLVSIYTSGSVDASSSTVAFFLPIVESARPSEGILWADAGLRLPGYGLLVQQKTLNDRAAVLQKFVTVSNRAWDYIFANHVDEAVDAIVKQRPNEKLDPKVLKGQIQLYMPLFATPATKGKPIGWQAEEDWAAALKAMEDAGVIKPGSKPSDYYTNQFIKG
jgi:NitT/TauT family transport system substrate-binding protein